MPISYTVVERINPRNLSAPKKFYVFPKTNGEMTLRELSKRIADISTYNIYYSLKHKYSIML